MRLRGLSNFKSEIMRYILLIAVLSVLSVSVCQAADVGKNNLLHGVVDERIELTSIVFRLAGAEEYCICAVKDYAADIDSTFAAYMDHPLMDYIRKMREERAIGFTRVPLSALHMYIEDGSVRTTPEMSKALVEEDYYWTEEMHRKYVSLLDDFYRKSGFHKFYERHEELYRDAERQFNTAVDTYLNAKWFEDTYGGKPLDGMKAYLCVNNGGSNYSLGNGTIVMGMFYSMQNDGGVVFPHMGVRTVAHELTHMLVEDECREYMDETRAAADTIFSYMGETLTKNGYSSAGLWSEWLTRVATLLYVRDNNPLGEYSAVMMDDSQGFIWQERTFRFLDNYMENRDRYRHFQDFVPQLAAYFNYTAENFERVMWEHENRRPYVVDVFPVPGTEIDLAAQDTIRIRFRFSEEMGVHCHGLKSSERNSPKGCNAKPGRMAKCIWTDSRTFEFAVPAEWYEKCDTLAFKLDRRIQDRFVNGIEEDYEVYYPLKH